MRLCGPETTRSSIVCTWRGQQDFAFVNTPSYDEDETFEANDMVLDMTWNAVIKVYDGLNVWML